MIPIWSMPIVSTDSTMLHQVWVTMIHGLTLGMAIPVSDLALDGTTGDGTLVGQSAWAGEWAAVGAGVLHTIMAGDTVVVLAGATAEAGAAGATTLGDIHIMDITTITETITVVTATV